MGYVDFAIDLTTGDRLVQDGAFVMARGSRAVAQWIWARLNTRKREWRLNPKYGWDVIQMMQKPVDKRLLEADLRLLIETTPGVDALTEFRVSYDLVARTMTVEATVAVSEEGSLSFTATTSSLAGWVLILGMV